MRWVARSIAGLLLVFVLGLAGCGGGGGGGNGGAGDVRHAPTANAGNAQSVHVGDLVTLDGAGSADAQGHALTFHWRLTARPSGSAASLSAADTARSTFTPDVAGDYVAALVVNDGQTDSPAASLRITATEPNRAPVADAGPNQNALVQRRVLLDGSASSDANGDPLSYRWLLSSRPAGSAAALDAASGPQLTFTPDVSGRYVATLTVSDGLLDSAPVTVTVNAATGNAVPVAFAGRDLSIATGKVVPIDGSSSSDANGDALHFAWTLIERPPASQATLSAVDIARPNLATDVDGIYRLSLVVNDGVANSAPDVIQITASSGSMPPQANAGNAQSVPTGTVVGLDGSASTDANNDALTYQWSLISKPAGSTARLNSGALMRPSFIVDKEGLYVASLVVSDGTAVSEPANVVISVTPAGAPLVVVDHAEPLVDTASLSLSRPVTGTVSWYVDLKLLASGSVTAVTFPTSWNTLTVSNGPHLVIARVQTGSGAPYEVRRIVDVSNSSVLMSASVVARTGLINVDVFANSLFGMTRVSAVFDGADFGTLTEPNVCSKFCNFPQKDLYRFIVDSAVARSGNHTIVITGVDAAGSSRQVTLAVPIYNLPTVALDKPLNGAIVSGVLFISGSAAVDRHDVITITASLGDVKFLQTTQSPFAASFDLTGVLPGNYVLTVRARDSVGAGTAVQRNVTVVR